MRPFRIGVAVGSVLVLCSGTRSAAQVPTRTLDAPTASYPQAFSLLQGIRELPDGRVMLADPLEQVVVVLDLDRGVADTLGRVGGGPGEYQQPDNVFPLPGDSTLLVDLANGRLVFLGPDGGFGETMPIAQQTGDPSPENPMGNMLVVMPAGVDRRGRVYMTPFGPGPRRRGPPPDSQAVVRWDRTSGEVDTMGMVKLPDREERSSGGAGRREVRVRPVPYSPRDGWGVGTDGRVALVRAEPYRVDWVLPDGSVRRGAPVEYRPVRIGRAEQEEWAEAGQAGALTMRAAVTPTGGMSMSFGRGAGRPQQEFDPRAYEWPDHKPPFAPDGIIVDPDGNVWVERSTPADEPALYDVFDSSGRLTEQVRMPEGRRVLGFGEGVVYTIRSDEFDLLWLERYVNGSRERGAGSGVGVRREM